MLDIRYRSQFKKDYKKIIKRGYEKNKLEEVICILAAGDPLPAKHKDHALIGNFKGYRECHIEADWLLVYKIKEDVLILTLVRTGTHSDLLKR